MKKFALFTLILPIALIGMEQKSEKFLPQGEVLLHNRTKHLLWRHVFSHVTGSIDKHNNKVENVIISQHHLITPDQKQHVPSGIVLRKETETGTHQLVSVWGHEITLFIRTLSETNWQIAQKDEELILKFSNAQEFKLDGPGAYAIEEKDGKLAVRKME